MSLKDGLILEFLENHDLELPPKPLYRNLNRHGHKIGYSTVRQRLDLLEEKGLLEKDDDGGYYSISDCGRAYLAGELEADDLE
ncbi:winged-helix domain-containing protein [Natrialbaceae archaeon GCM10025810]|uniref:winged-helix domain-containing protein n=1 Tax=Halovalidus salilacus TaxID=3075124 RepID=UPI003610A7D9